MSAAIDWVFDFGLFLAGLAVCLFLIFAIVVIIVASIEKIKEVRKDDRTE